MHTKWPSITWDRRNLQNLNVRGVKKSTREEWTTAEYINAMSRYKYREINEMVF